MTLPPYILKAEPEDEIEITYSPLTQLESKDELSSDQEDELLLTPKEEKFASEDLLIPKEEQTCIIKQEPLMIPIEEAMVIPKQEPSVIIKQEQLKIPKEECPIKHEVTSPPARTVSFTEPRINIPLTGIPKETPSRRRSPSFFVPLSHRKAFYKLPPNLRTMYWNLPFFHRMRFLQIPRSQQADYANECMRRFLPRQPPFNREPRFFPFPETSHSQTSDDFGLSTTDPDLARWKKYSLFKVGIWDTYYMSVERIDVLKRCLLWSIVVDNTNSRVPRVYDCFDQRGWLQISCKDEESRDWINRTVRDLKPWADAQLNSLECDQVQDYIHTTISVRVRDACNIQEMVSLLKKQNRGLSVDDWHINNVYYVDDLLMVDLTLNDDHINELRRVNYNPCVGFGRAVVHLPF